METEATCSMDPSKPKVVEVIIAQKMRRVAVAADECGTHAGSHVPVNELPTISVVEACDVGGSGG